MPARAVEFIGGPFDGLTQSFDRPPARLPRRTRLPVNASLLNFLASSHPLESVHGPATSIALYALDTTGDTPRYRHLHSVAAQRELRNV